jgi:hypothetical protein|tara:strand:+ start:1666 stop:2073 length:408 start_codon:yes stop_codon:yes gene_type:complete
MLDDELRSLLSFYKLHLTMDEAYLIDWLITLHSYDGELYERLNSPELTALKAELGRVLLQEKDYIEIEETEFKWVFTSCPITFRWGYGEDVGMSLKTKLYRLFIYGIDTEEESSLDSSESEAQIKMDLSDQSLDT